MTVAASPMEDNQRLPPNIAKWPRAGVTSPLLRTTVEEMQTHTSTHVHTLPHSVCSSHLGTGTFFVLLFSLGFFPFVVVDFCLFCFCWLVGFWSKQETLLRSWLLFFKTVHFTKPFQRVDYNCQHHWPPLCAWHSAKHFTCVFKILIIKIRGESWYPILQSRELKHRQGESLDLGCTVFEWKNGIRT